MLAIIYGALAITAFWATWRDEDLRWIGVWLVGGWALSNMVAELAPVTYRPGPYTLIEMMVATAAYCAWGIHRKHRYAWALVAIVIFNTASIALNIAFAWSFPPEWRQIHVFEVGTNLCFAAECLLATGVGVADGYRTGRFHWRPLFRRSIAQPDAARQRVDP